jgi:hypothetical protein
VNQRGATAWVISVFGLLAGLAGLEHGIGEALQGGAAPAGLVFPSWPHAVFFRSVAGEPAMSLVPNLLASGILTILVSLGFLVWAIAFPGHRAGGPVLLGLSVVLLLVGGGFGPPLLGIILGFTATRAQTARARPASGLRRALAALWPWCFTAAITAWLLVMPGTMLLDGLFGSRHPEVMETLVPVFILAAFGLLALAIVTGLVRDRLAGQLPAAQAGSWGSELRAARR